MKDKKSVKSSKPTSQQKKHKKRRKSSKWGAPMVTTGGKGTPYTYPTGNSNDYQMNLTKLYCHRKFRQWS